MPIHIHREEKKNEHKNIRKENNTTEIVNNQRRNKKNTKIERQTDRQARKCFTKRPAI